MLRYWNLRRTNNFLLAAIVVVNLYVILAPFAPSVIFWWEKDHTNRSTQLTQLLQQKKTTSPTTTNQATPTQNSLVIPSMLLNTPILESAVRNEYSTLDQGVWRWPLGSTPDQGGNTILIGHRFTYTNPRGIFYELNKVNVGDQIGVFWSGKEYLYTVSSTSVVPPNQTSILAQTTQPELTLYTCTPTWNPINRLVVVATLTSVRSVTTT